MYFQCPYCDYRHDDGEIFVSHLKGTHPARTDYNQMAMEFRQAAQSADRERDRQLFYEAERYAHLLGEIYQWARTDGKYPGLILKKWARDAHLKGYDAAKDEIGTRLILRDEREFDRWSCEHRLDAEKAELAQLMAVR